MIRFVSVWPCGPCWCRQSVAPVRLLLPAFHLSAAPISLGAPVLLAAYFSNKACALCVPRATSRFAFAFACGSHQRVVEKVHRISILACFLLVSSVFPRCNLKGFILFGSLILVLNFWGGCLFRDCRIAGGEWGL